MEKRHSKPIWLLVALFSVTINAQDIWAQSDDQLQSSAASQSDANQVEITSAIDNGLQEVTFATPNGNIVAKLPAEFMVTDHIWGTISYQIAGRNLQQQNENLAAMKQLSVQMKPDNGKAVSLTADRRPKTLRIPEGCKDLSVSLYDPIKRRLSTFRMPCATQASSTLADPGRVVMPQVAVPKRNFRCGVVSDGSPGAALCKIDGHDCPPSAGSPRCQWFQVPQDVPLGRAPIQCYLPNSNRIAQSQICVVKPVMSAPKLMHIGDRGMTTIQLKGLSGVQGAKLIFRNLSPQSISVSGGNYQEIPVSAAD